MKKRLSQTQILAIINERLDKKVYNINELKELHGIFEKALTTFGSWAMSSISMEQKVTRIANKISLRLFEALAAEQSNTAKEAHHDKQ